MKLLIASDIHGSAYYCRLLLTRLQEERPDTLLLLGDYYTTVRVTIYRVNTLRKKSSGCSMTARYANCAYAATAKRKSIKWF